MPDTPDEQDEQFDELRPLLFSLAYRLLGTVSDAEDAVQETWVRFATSGTRPESPKAFLSTVVTRVCLNELNSARRRREQYVGPWFPEPLVEDPYQDPQRAAELRDSVSIAALLLMERLSPLERAVFVLREVFGVEYAQIATTVERSESACRQLAARARRHMEQGRARFESDPRVQQELAERVFAALSEGDVDSLSELLAADVQLAADSGGKAPSLPRTITGSDQVARVLTMAASRLRRIGITPRLRNINGQLGALFCDQRGNVLSAMVLETHGGQVQAVRSVFNPDKLGHLGPLADAWAVREDFLRAARGQQQGD